MSCLHLARPVSSVKGSLRFSVISRRMFSEHCNDTEEIKNKCTTKNFMKKPCETAKKNVKNEIPKGQYEFSFKSMWNLPMCCEYICDPNMKPMRHDVEFLKQTNRTERPYQRTWYQCPEVVCGKKTCIQHKIKVPIPDLRPRGVGNPAAKWVTKLNDCAKIEKYEKPCEACRPRKVCKLPRSTGCCMKRCTLYPSYSECYKRCKKPKRPNECTSPTGLCAVVKLLEERGLLNKNSKTN